MDAIHTDVTRVSPTSNTHDFRSWRVRRDRRRDSNEIGERRPDEKSLSPQRLAADAPRRVARRNEFHVLARDDDPNTISSASTERPPPLFRDAGRHPQFDGPDGSPQLQQPERRMIGMSEQL